jgi:hypothetical protein
MHGLYNDFHNMVCAAAELATDYFIEELDVLRVITRKTSNSSNFPPFLEEGGLGGMVILLRNTLILIFGFRKYQYHTIIGFQENRLTRWRGNRKLQPQGCRFVVYKNSWGLLSQKLLIKKINFGV